MPYDGLAGCLLRYVLVGLRAGVCKYMDTVSMYTVKILRSDWYNMNQF